MAGGNRLRMGCYTFPLSVDFDITLSCNLQCIHCNVQGGASVIRNEMSLDQVKRVIEQLYEHGIVDISITGGEPLCRRDWRQIVEHACSLDSWRVEVNTNGILWTESDVEFLSSLKNRPVVAVSIDGPNPEIYALLRNIEPLQAGAVFEKVILNVQQIAGVAKVCINFTITGMNHQYFFDTVELARELNAQSFLGIKVFPVGRAKAHYQNLEISQLDWKSLVQRATALKMSKALFYDSVFLSVTCPWELIIPLREMPHPLEELFEVWNYLPSLFNPNFRGSRGIGCTAGITNFGLSPDGIIYPCGTVSANVPGLECGSIRNEGFGSVWKSSSLLNRLRQVTIADVGMPCIECRYSAICGGGCRIRALLMTGDIQSPDPACPFTWGGDLK